MSMLSLCVVALLYVSPSLVRADVNADTCSLGNDVSLIKECYESAFGAPLPSGNLPVKIFESLHPETFGNFCGDFRVFQNCLGGDIFRIPLLLRQCRVDSLSDGQAYVIAHDMFLQFGYVCSKPVFDFAKASLPCLTKYYFPSQADRLCAESAFNTVRSTLEKDGGQVMNRSTRCYALALHYHCTLGAMDYMCGPTGKELLDGIWHSRNPLIAPCSLESLPTV